MANYVSMCLFSVLFSKALKNEFAEAHKQFFLRDMPSRGGLLREIPHFTVWSIGGEKREVKSIDMNKAVCVPD